MTISTAPTRRSVLATGVGLVAVAGLGACASTPTPKSVADSLADRADLSTLAGLVQRAGLTDTLRGAGPFTLFAPTNAAFAKVPAATLATLQANPEQLRNVLTYHVLPARVLAKDVMANTSAKSVQGANLGVSRAGTFVTVEDALVTQADVMATNGVIHVVDAVLLPPAPPRR